jgi:hypothetical protein
MRHQRFIPSPSQLPPAGFSAGFSAVAHDHGLLSHSRTAWFDACLCQPTPRGLPSSPSVVRKNWSFSPSFHVALFGRYGVPAGRTCLEARDGCRERGTMTCIRRSCPVHCSITRPAYGPDGRGTEEPSRRSAITFSTAESPAERAALSRGHAQFQHDTHGTC